MIIALRLARCVPAFAAAQSAGLCFFSESEQQRYDSFSAAARREQFVASRWLARELLAEHYGGAPTDWALTAEAGAAPRVLGAAPLHLGLSHSGDWVACAIAAAPVGLDVETTTRPRKVAALAEMVCTPAERAQLAALSPQPQLLAFYRMWTIKEAWLKQHGRGLDFSLMRSVDAHLDAGSPTALTLIDAQASLCVAVTADVITEPLLLHSELGFEIRRWMLDTRGIYAANN